MTEHIREAIERTKKCFTKRSELGETGEKVVAHFIYFGGKSEKLGDEIKEIAENIRRANVKKFEYNEKRGIYVPSFELLDAEFGIMEENVARRVSMSDAYFEIIGDGFGDTSLSLAMTSYRTAKRLEIPTRILVKSERVANHPEYASEFLEEVDRERVIRYDKPELAAAIVVSSLEEIFE